MQFVLKREKTNPTAGRDLALSSPKMQRVCVVSLTFISLAALYFWTHATKWPISPEPEFYNGAFS